MATLKMISVCLFMVVFPVGETLEMATWEYSGPLGPDQWYTKYKHCGGRMQSPINVQTSHVVYDGNLQPFDDSQYSSMLDFNMTLKNVAGHTVEVIYGGSPITLKGGSLPDDYLLDQFHFHWGSSDNKGSEHLVNGIASPMEMHVVHHMKKFSPSTSSSQPYGLAVLAFFFKIGDHNPNFDPLLTKFDEVVQKDAQTTVPPFSLSSLLSGDGVRGKYYRYLGSLTTPPCYETVIWSVFQNKIPISRQQLDKFRSLHTVLYQEHRSNDGKTKEVEVSISDDFRPVQPLHARTVTTNDASLVTRVSQAKDCSSGTIRIGGGLGWGTLTMIMFMMVILVLSGWMV